MTLIYTRKAKGHFKATFFSLETFLEGGKKQTSQTQHISMSSFCLFVYLLNSSAQEQTCQTISMLV